MPAHKTILAMTSALCLVLSASAFARGGGHFAGGHHFGGGMHVADLTHERHAGRFEPGEHHRHKLHRHHKKDADGSFSKDDDDEDQVSSKDDDDEK